MAAVSASCFFFLSRFLSPAPASTAAEPAARTGRDAAGSSKIPASSGRKAILNSFIMVRKIYFFNAFSMLRSNNS